MFFIDFYWLTRKSTHLQIWVSCDYLRAVSIETCGNFVRLYVTLHMFVHEMWFICCFFFQFLLSCILIIMNNKEEIDYELEHFRDVIYIDSSFKLKGNKCILMILIRASDSGIKHNVCCLKVPVSVGRGQGHPKTFPRISSLPLDIGTFPGWLHAESHSLWIGPYAQPKSQHRCVAMLHAAGNKEQKMSEQKVTLEVCSHSINSLMLNKQTENWLRTWSRTWTWLSAV